MLPFIADMTVIARLKIHLPLQNGSAEEMLMTRQKYLRCFFVSCYFAVEVRFPCSCGRNASLSGKSTFFKCQHYFKGHWMAFHCWSIITPSIKPPCSPFPCQCHHQPLWLWMSVKPFVLFNLFIARQSALTGSYASKIWSCTTVWI